MSGRENPIRKNAARLGAGLVGFGLAFGGNELIKPGKPEPDPMHDVDSESDTADSAPDSGPQGEVPIRVDLPTPLSLEDKINGADPVLEELLDKGYKDFTVATDGTTLEVYNADGVKALNLWPLGDSWKVTISTDSRAPEWSRMSGINLAEPVVTSGEDIQGIIDAYDQIADWRKTWTDTYSNTSMLSFVGSTDFPVSQESRDKINDNHDDQLATLEAIIVKSDNPLIEHPTDEAN